jgi:predicted nucleotidyltransferase
MREPPEEHRLLSADEVREGMRVAMAKASRRGKVILFGGYSRGDFLTDIDIMIVVDDDLVDAVADTMQIRDCIEIDKGFALYLITSTEYEISKDCESTAAWEAEVYGIVLFDNRDGS